MPDAVVVLSGEPQVGGQALAISEQALHRRLVGGAVLGGYLDDPVTDQLSEPGPGLVFRPSVSLQAFSIEEGPVGVLDLGLHPARTLARTLLPGGSGIAGAAPWGRPARSRRSARARRR
jgi:hypothetical protein